jgi:hypothetical protein
VFIWIIIPVLVSCIKKNLATLPESTYISSLHWSQFEQSGYLARGTGCPTTSGVRNFYFTYMQFCHLMARSALLLCLLKENKGLAHLAPSTRQNMCIYLFKTSIFCYFFPTCRHVHTYIGIRLAEKKNILKFSFFLFFLYYVHRRVLFSWTGLQCLMSYGQAGWPNWAILYFGQFIENHKSRRAFCAIFSLHGYRLCINSDKNWVRQHFGRFFFKNWSGHPASDASIGEDWRLIALAASLKSDSQQKKKEKEKK